MKVRGLVLTAAMACLAPGALGQEKDPRVNPPVAPVGVESTSKAPNSATPPVQTQTIEKEPLSGSRWPGLGFLGGARNYLIPSFAFSQAGDIETSGNDVPRAQSQINAGLKLRREWERYLVDLDYSVGGLIYSTDQTAFLVQGLGLSQTIALRRWTITISDSFSYLPESGFGAPLLGNVGGQSSLGTGVLSGNPLFNPAQTILTGGNRRITNAASVQAQYDMNRSLSFTATGGYSIFRFLDNAAGLIENNSMTLQGGANYRFNRFDTVAGTYSLQQTRFLGGLGGFDSHTVQLSYARRLTGRMTVQIGAGPQIQKFNLPGQTRDDRISWSAVSRVLLAFRNSDIGIGYSRNSTNGSGVLLGASTDSVDGSYTRRFFRTWGATFGGGYARNTSLAQLSSGPSEVRFTTWRGNTSVGRNIGRSVNLNITYSYQTQDQSACGALVGCLQDSRRHVLGLVFSWNFKPIELD